MRWNVIDYIVDRDVLLFLFVLCIRHRAIPEAIRSNRIESQSYLNIVIEEDEIIISVSVFRVSIFLAFDGIIRFVLVTRNEQEAQSGQGKEIALRHNDKVKIGCKGTEKSAYMQVLF